ncbi:MAG: DUF5617 domain-containing protein [Tatlockia sp.]|nr:DUF5617 domain-containing protein [Tatlockia sp.]
MILKQLLNLLDWFEASDGDFPVFLINSHADLKNELEQTMLTQEILSKVELFLNHYLQKTKSFNVYQASLLWLIDSHKSNGKLLHRIRTEKKIGIIFSSFLEKMPEIAINFYNTEVDLKKIYPTGLYLIAALEEKNKDSSFELKQLIDDKKAKLNNLSDPLSILLHINYSDTLNFAAYIIWLLQRKVSEESIFASGVLQSFFMFHFYQLDEPDNEVRNLYSLLSTFEVTQRLVHLSTKTSAGSKAFKYNLQGQICLEEQLTKIDLIKPSFIGAIDESLFNELLFLFGTKFLDSALNHYHDTDDNSDHLIQALNLNGKAFSSLPQLIKNIRSSYSEYSREKHLDSLAKLISKETLLSHLYVNKEWLMLYLLPFYKTESVLTKNELMGHITQFVEYENISLDYKFDILKFLQNWSKEKKYLECSHFFYQQILTLTLLTAENLNQEGDIVDFICKEYTEMVQDDADSSSSYSYSDDENYPLRVSVGNIPNSIDLESNEESSEDTSLDEASSSSENSSIDDVAETYKIETSQCIEALCLDLKTQWQVLINEKLGNSNFNHRDFQFLQDKWNIYKQKRDIFRRLGIAINENWTLKELLINERFRLVGDTFILADFIAILFDLSNEKEIFKSQKAIVKVLLNNQNLLLTNQIICSLTEVNRFWHLIPWLTGKSIIIEAVKQQHFQLTAYLLHQFSLNPFEEHFLHGALLTAIEKSNPKICSLFFIPEIINQFDDNQIFMVFLKALADQKAFELLMDNKNLFHLSNETCSSLIYKAAQEGSDWVFSYLCNKKFGYEPNTQTMDKALLNATKNKKWHFIEKMYSLDIQKPGNQGVSDAWEYAATFEQDDQLNFLARCYTSFSKNKIWTCILFLLTTDHLGSLDFLIQLAEKHELSSEELEFRQASILVKIRDHIIPNSKFLMLDTIYKKFKPEFHPNQKIVQEGFKIVFKNKSKETFKVFYKYGIQHLDNEILLSSFAQAILENHPFSRYLLMAIKKKGEMKGAEIAKNLLSRVGPNAKSKIFEYIYPNFPYLYPDTATVNEHFKYAFVNKNNETIKVLCSHAHAHLDNEILISSLATSLQNLKISGYIKKAINNKIISPTQFGNLIVTFAKINDFISISLIKDASPKITELEEAICITARAGFYESFLELLQASQLINENAKLIPKILKIALQHNQTLFIFNFCNSVYFQFENKIQFIPLLIKSQHYGLLTTLCNSDSHQSSELWSYAFMQAVKAKNIRSLGFLCKSKYIHLRDWKVELEKATSHGELEQVQALVIAANSESFSIDFHLLKQIAEKEGRSELIDWFDQIKALEAYNKLASTKNPVLDKAYEILSDYTKSGSSFMRFFTGHWNRHYIKEIDELLETFPDSIDELVSKLKRINIQNPKGSLARRINYIFDFLLPFADEYPAVNLQDNNQITFI